MYGMKTEEARQIRLLTVRSLHSCGNSQIFGKISSGRDVWKSDKCRSGQKRQGLEIAEREALTAEKVKLDASK